MTREQETLSGLDAGGLFPRLQARFGLRDDPTAMEAPFYPDAGRQHALETLRHLCGFGDMALFLTGTRGAGKSRILAELIRSESSRLAFHHLPAQRLTSTEALGRALMNVMNHSRSSDGYSPRDAVYRFFRWSEQATRKGQRMVLLIDDADQMPAELVSLMLAAYRAAEPGAAAVPVFAGTEQLLRKVQALPAMASDQSGLHQIHLRPLTAQEVFSYLEPRVRAAGGDVRELLSDGNLGRIHSLSQGSFGRLKRVTPAVWLDLAAPSKGSSFTLPGLAALRWPALALLLLGASWWLVSQQYETVSKTAPAPETSPVVRKTVTIGPESPEMPAVPDGALPPAELSPRTVVDQPLSGAEEAAPELADAGVPEAGDAPEDAGGTEPGGSQPEPLAASSEEAPDLPVAETPSPLQPEPPEPVTEDPATEVEAAGEEKAPRQQAVTDPGTGFSPAMPERFVPLDQLRNAQGYTAQYIAGYEEETAVDFLAAHGEVDGLRYTRSERQGRPWFVVFYGQYESPGAAREALTSLPPGLRQQDAWIRPLAGF